MHRIGFMQGRLCDQVDGKIQAFPWNEWKSEFSAAASIGLKIMEWTLDQDRLYENPLMVNTGQAMILQLASKFRINIPSITCDCMMQSPFWKEDGPMRQKFLLDFQAILYSCLKININKIIIPLVDNGRLENIKQEDILVNVLLDLYPFFTKNKFHILFESDYDHIQLLRFISRLPVNIFGINYDIGNSASFGFNPEVEFSYYGDRINNVHVKDRLVGGSTVPLGSGSADFHKVFELLAKANYNGNYILQTARSIDGNHKECLINYKYFVSELINNNKTIS